MINLDDLKHCLKPVVIKGSAFDIDYDAFLYRSLDIVNNDILFDNISGLCKPNSPFDIRHQIIYDFFNVDFQLLNSKRNEKINIFENLINKFIINKKAVVTPSGLQILNLEGGDINLNDLSSGERKIIALLFCAIFSENNTIMVDEPEISISLYWQKILIPILLNETSVAKILVATHSPFLIEDDSVLKYLLPLMD